MKMDNSKIGKNQLIIEVFHVHEAGFFRARTALFCVYMHFIVL